MKPDYLDSEIDSSIFLSNTCMFFKKETWDKEERSDQAAYMTGQFPSNSNFPQMVLNHTLGRMCRQNIVYKHQQTNLESRLIWNIVEETTFEVHYAGDSKHKTLTGKRWWEEHSGKKVKQDHADEILEILQQNAFSLTI